MVAVANIEKIHDLKKDQVRECVEVAKKHSKVKRMIIFGSAVSDDCHETSDLDICLDIWGDTQGLDMYELARDLSISCDHNCDILTYSRLSKDFRNEVDRKGVTVYELS